MKTRTNGTRAALVIGGALATMVGMGAGIGGGALVWAHSTQRDARGFYATSAERLTTPSYALLSPELDFGTNPADSRWLPGSGSSFTGRVEVTTADGGPVFVGLARQRVVDSYLARSAYDEVTDFDVLPFRAEYRRSSGEERPAPPTSQSFWLASAHGEGTQSVTFPMEADDMAVVVMKPDGSPGLTVDVAVGAKTGVLLPVGLGFAVLALVLSGLGTAAIVAGSAGRRTSEPSSRSTGTVGAPNEPTTVGAPH